MLICLQAKKEFLSQKWKPDVFVDFWPPYWCPMLVHQQASPYKALLNYVKLFGKLLENGAPHRPETWICCVFVWVFFSFWLLSFHSFKVIFSLRDSENTLLLTVTACYHLTANLHFLELPIFKRKLEVLYGNTLNSGKNEKILWSYTENILYCLGSSCSKGGYRILPDKSLSTV